MSTTIARLRALTTQVVHIAVDGANLTGELTVPEDALGVIVFCHTNAAPRSNRDARHVAAELRKHGFATLLFDLLTPDEEMIDATTRHLRCDLPLLARRVIETVDWLNDTPNTEGLGIGLFGDGAGAAAAFVAACVRPQRVAAVVAHTDDLDLAAPVLGRVRAPALLIVAGASDAATRATATAFRRLRTEKELVMIAGSAPPFEQAGDVGEISRLALAWFGRHVAQQLPLVEPVDEF